MTGGSEWASGNSEIVLGCLVCGQDVRLDARPGEFQFSVYIDHLFRGETPMLWLRPGELCPASGVAPNTMYEGEESWSSPQLTELGRRWPSRRGEALAWYRHSLYGQTLPPGHNPVLMPELFWPRIYGPHNP